MTVAPGAMKSRGNHGGAADGGNQNIGRRGKRRRDPAVREWQMVTVAFSCSSISAIGLADDIAAAEHDGALAGDGNLVALQQFDDARRRAGARGGSPATR